MAIPQYDAAFQGAYGRAPLQQFRVLLSTSSTLGPQSVQRSCDSEIRTNPTVLAKTGFSSFGFQPSIIMPPRVFFRARSLKFHLISKSGTRYALAFEPEDIFDWMVLEQGHLYGGYTLRVAREKLPEAERESYDRHIGVSVYEPDEDS